MRFPSFRLVGIGFFVLAASAPIGGTAQPPQVADAVAWYDTLGFPDAARLRYVRVATGRSIQFQDGTRQVMHANGFLVADAPDTFSVFVFDLAENRLGWDDRYSAFSIVPFRKKSTGPIEEHVGFEETDFQRDAENLLARLRSTPATILDDMRLPPWGFAARTRIFGFARACLQRGLTTQGSALMEIAARLPDPATGERPIRPLAMQLQIEMGDGMWWRAETAFGNPAVSWSELLTIYQDFPMRYPSSVMAAQAMDRAGLLQAMMREAAAHDAGPPLTPVQEAIYQLQNEQVACWWGAKPYPDTVDARGPVTPVHALVDLGPAAVPALIAALDDQRFTRSLSAHCAGSGPGRPRAMRVSDLAQRILEFEAGRSFFARAGGNGAGINGTTRQQAQAWWTEMQTRGERQILVERASAGTMDGLQAADMLVEKYPEAALGAIEAAVRAAPNAMMRGAYVEKAASLRGPAVTAFLRAQLAPPAGLPAQLAAANALFGRAEPAGVRVMPVMIDAWRRIQPELRRPRLQYADPTVPTNEPDAFDSVDGLIDFLATSGDARALVSLDQESRGAPVGVRLAVARVFLPSPWNASGFNVGASNNPSDRATFPGGAAGAAIERLLVSSLDDRERAFGVDVNQDRRTMQDPRVADVAAAALAKRWPATYVFTWTGTSAERDRDIEAIRTRWRRDHGIRAAPSAAAPRRAADSSESDVVRDVRVEGGGPPTPEIASLKGQTLTADRLLALAVALERTLPPDKYEVTCLVARPDSGAGFVVTMTWRPGTVAGQTGWERDLFVHAGETRVFEDAGYSISENNRGGDRVRPIDHHYRRLADAFGTSLETRRHEPIEVSIRIQRVAVVPYRIGPRVP